MDVRVEPRSSEYLDNRAEPTKLRLNLHGRIYLFCVVKSKGFVSEEVGESSGNMRRDFFKLVEGAKINAIYKHIKSGGRTGAKVIVKDYLIMYFDTRISFSRVRYRAKKEGKKGSYRAITRINGRIVSNDPWSIKRKVL